MRYQYAGQASILANTIQAYRSMNGPTVIVVHVHSCAYGWPPWRRVWPGWRLRLREAG